MTSKKQKQRLENERKSENLQPGEYGVPEAPPARQSRDPKAGLHIDEDQTSTERRKK